MKRALSFLIFFLSVYISKSQINDTIYFSKLGDTVLFSPYANGYTYSDSMTHHLFVMSFDKKDTLKKISSLDILVNRKDRLEDFISLDTFISNITYHKPIISVLQLRTPIITF